MFVTGRISQLPPPPVPNTLHMRNEGEPASIWPINLIAGLVITAADQLV